MKMIKRLIFCLAAVAPMTLLPGCTYETHTQQFSFAARPKSPAAGANLRALAMDFAKRNGFAKETKAGNSGHLEKGGVYIISFIANDESYISLNNVSDKGCYSVGVYSASGDASASAIGQRLIQLLNEMKIDDEMIVPQSKCN